jgi:peptide/nickel transport system ATP-binding protein
MTSVVETLPVTAAQERSGLVELRDLVVDYATADRVVRAVDNVNLSIAPGEIVGLAGESGCGKSTVAHALLQILRFPAQLSGGSIVFDGRDLATLSEAELRRFRWRNVSLVFQSAMNALNPVLRVGDQFVDMMRAHEPIRKKDALERAADLLEIVGIERSRVRAYPHELSGGMRQRVIIAMALALRPELVVMDEPTTALDVVVQREILQQVQELQRQLGFAVLFITHDLSLLLEFAHRVAIMYAGEIVEIASADSVLRKPRHPYTVGLTSSFPPLTGPLERMTGIPGSPPDLARPPAGCRFHPRCPHCIPGEALYELQTTVKPELLPVEPDHLVACHLVEAES